jgi:hypothetical protein
MENSQKDYNYASPVTMGFFYCFNRCNHKEHKIIGVYDGYYDCLFNIIVVLLNVHIIQGGTTDV